MGIDDRAKAVAKNIEGQAQKTVGDITGNVKDQIEGQAKQDESAAIHLKEDIKDKAKQIVEEAL